MIFNDADLEAILESAELAPMVRKLERHELDDGTEVIDFRSTKCLPSELRHEINSHALRVLSMKIEESEEKRDRSELVGRLEYRGPEGAR